MGPTLIELNSIKPEAPKWIFWSGPQEEAYHCPQRSDAANQGDPEARLSSSWLRCEEKDGGANEGYCSDQRQNKDNKDIQQHGLSPFCVLYRAYPTLVL